MFTSNPSAQLAGGRFFTGSLPTEPSTPVMSVRVNFAQTGAALLGGWLPGGLFRSGAVPAGLQFRPKKAASEV